MKEKHNKINRISVRLSDFEFYDLESKANISGINISEYIRHIILHSKPPIHKFDKAMTTQISRIENNTNQIAKYVNTTKSIDIITLKKDFTD